MIRSTDWGREMCPMPVLALPVTTLDKPLNRVSFFLSLKLFNFIDLFGPFHRFKLDNTKEPNSLHVDQTQ